MEHRAPAAPRLDGRSAPTIDRRVDADCIRNARSRRSRARLAQKRDLFRRNGPRGANLGAAIDRRAAWRRDILADMRRRDRPRLLLEGRASLSGYTSTRDRRTRTIAACTM